MSEHGAAVESEEQVQAGRGLAGASAEADRCIARYVERCRSRIPSFVDRHFTLAETWRLQRKSLGRDLLFAPLNSAWALPYVAVQKAADALDRVGYPRPAHWAKHVSPGVQSGYQAGIERLLGAELLEWDRGGPVAELPQGFLGELRAVPVLSALAEPLEREAARRRPGRRPSDLLRQYTAGRAIVSDLAGTVLTLLLSWWTLGSTSMSLRGIAQGVAKRSAHDRAASRFFLGKKLGSHFYNVFPPEVSASTVWMILALLVALLAVGAMACTILSDPIRRMLGFHRNRLEFVLDELEKELIVLTHKTIALSAPACSGTERTPRAAGSRLASPSLDPG